MFALFHALHIKKIDFANANPLFPVWDQCSAHGVYRILCLGIE